MPFKRPTIQELNERGEANITTRLPGADANLRRKNTKGLAGGLTGYTHGLYLHQEHIARQLFPDSCDEENLLRHAAIRGLIRKGATKAIGQVDFTGDIGAVIPRDTIVTAGNDTEFETTADITLIDGTGTGDVRAILEGVASNIEPSEALNFSAPRADVNSVAIVGVSGLSNGADLESVDELRARVLKVWRQPPQGGAGHDYQHWALAVEGVTRVWVTPNALGVGTVTVRYVLDGEIDIFPSTEHLALVKTYIEARRPITAEVTVLSPAVDYMNLTIQVSPLTEAVKAAIEAELKDLILRVSEPGCIVFLSQIREAVSIAAGERNNAVISPTGDVIYGPGTMPQLGLITWGEVA